MTRILIAGLGGHGVLTLGRTLAEAASIKKKAYLEIHDYSAEVRGGWVYSSVIISDSDIHSPVCDSYDIAIFFDNASEKMHESKLTKDTLILRAETTPHDTREHTNMLMLGILAKITGLFATDALETAIRQTVPGTTTESNIESFRRGLEIEKS